MNQLDPAAIGFRSLAAGVRSPRPFQIVDQGQQFPEKVGCCRLGLCLPIALRPFAEVVELRRLPQQEVVEFVALPLELLHRHVRRLGSHRGACRFGRFAEVDV